MAEVTSIQIEFDAEFDSESNSAVFEAGFRSKKGTSPQNTTFFRFLGKVFGVKIRYFISVESKSGRVKFCIKFRVEWGCWG